jgi:predicted nucleic acid-binding protein
LAGVIVADASWFIALRDPDDAHHRTAVVVNDTFIDEIIVLHPVTLAECLVGPARLGRLDAAASGARAAFEIVDVDDDAPLRWARLRAATTLRLPDVIVLDTAIFHAATAILTFDQQLAAEATGRSIASPATDDELAG